MTLPAAVLADVTTDDVVPSARQVAYARDLMNLRSGQRGEILVVRDVARSELLRGAWVAEASATATPFARPWHWALTVAEFGTFAEPPPAVDGDQEVTVFEFVHVCFRELKEEFL